MAWAQAQREQKLSTVPSTIGEEMSYNPFMRTHLPHVQKRVGASDPIDAMRLIRALKDKF